MLEYKSIDLPLNEDPVPELNRLATEGGWECCGMVRVPRNEVAVGGEFLRVMLKRHSQEELRFYVLKDLPDGQKRYCDWAMVRRGQKWTDVSYDVRFEDDTLDKPLAVQRGLFWERRHDKKVRSGEWVEVSAEVAANRVRLTVEQLKAYAPKQKRSDVFTGS